jgi:hypothetical protein
MTNDKSKLKELVNSIVNEDYINAKERLESAVESTIVAHFKTILENKENK